MEEGKLIKTKDEDIELNDIIEIECKQIKEINEKSKKKTIVQWEEDKDGIKIKLTEKQMEKILNEKNSIFGNMTIDQLTEEGVIKMTSHISNRIAERLEGKEENDFADEETIDEVIKMLKDSKKVSKQATWKGEEKLRYGFEGEYEGIKCEMVISFNKKEKIIMITLITEKNTNTPLREKLKDYKFQI